MKSLFIFLISLLIFGGSVSAQTPEASPSATKAPQQKDIDIFKEKLASKVAELNKKNKKVVAGAITAISGSTIKLTTDEDEKFDIKFDPDLTEFFEITGATKTAKKTSELKKGIYIIVSGPEVDKTVEANFIYQDEQFVVDAGRVIEVDKTDNSLVIQTLRNEKYTLDTTLTTRQQIMNIKTLEFEQGTFSKVKEGDNVHFVAEKDSQVKNRSEALRITIIPQEYFIK
jgi:hypothetical protein